MAAQSPGCIAAKSNTGSALTTNTPNFPMNPTINLPGIDRTLQAYTDLDQAAEIVLKIIEKQAAKIEGIKISLLDKEREIRSRPVPRDPRTDGAVSSSHIQIADLLLQDWTQKGPLPRSLGMSKTASQKGR
jgi:hypothetical protein